MTNNKIIKQLEHKLDLFAEMMDVLEGGDCIEDMEDINTTDIETIMTLLSAFHDKTCGTINNVKWYETTFHNKS